jgi:hypothetical protein
MVESCGASLPLVDQDLCTGIARAVATCIDNHVANCDDLAGLAGHLDQCVADAADGGDIAPAEDLSLPPLDDAGADAAKHDAEPLSQVDAAARDSAPLDATGVADAGPDAGTDAGAEETTPDANVAPDSGPPPWPGLVVTGTVTYAVEDRYTTPTLPAGTYNFAIAGTGDADLYVKRGSIPKTNTYDCRPYLTGSDESCSITLTVPTIIYLMVRGEDTSSTYTLTGNP